MDKTILLGFVLLIIGGVLKKFFSAQIPSFLISGVFLAAALLFVISIAKRGGGC